MKNKYVFVAVLLAAILLAGIGFTAVYLHQQGREEEDDGFTVVTSFYPMYVAARNVVGDQGHVRLENLSEPQTGCLHDYQLTSEDMKLLATADVFIINGGGIETFLADVAAEYPDLTLIDASEHVELLGENAHAWMSMEDYSVQVQTICSGLSEADPAGADQYAQNAERYLEKIDALRAEYRDAAQVLRGKSVVLFHEAYEYLTDEFGMQEAALLNLDEERQVSAGEVADILSAIEEEQVSVILAEERYGRDMGDMMEQESSVQVVYLDPLNRGDYSADSYLDGMRSNLELLIRAFEDSTGE